VFDCPAFGGAGARIDYNLPPVCVTALEMDPRTWEQLAEWETLEKD
jgi:hypothetical protein